LLQNDYDTSISKQKEIAALGNAISFFNDTIPQSV